MIKRRRPANRCNRWTAFFTVLALLNPVALYGEPAITGQLPEMGDVSGNIISPEQERRLAQAFMRQIRASGRLVDDPLIEDYLQRLGNTLVQHSSVPLGQQFNFFLLDDPSINAFAGPGGSIGIHSGLLLTTRSESELAAVLAHEIAHVSQKHLQRTWQATSDLSTPQAALMLAAILLGATAGGDAGIAAMMGGQAALIQQQINFTRANEKEADRVGIAILADADFETRAMPSFFTRMGRANRSSSVALPEFLRTHPVTTNRIADALGRAESFPYHQHLDSLDYYLTRAMLRKRAFDNPDDAVDHFRRLLKDHRYQSETATRYGLVLSLIDARRIEEARNQLRHLTDSNPDHTAFIVARARLELADNNPHQASEILRKALLGHPLDYPLQITLTESLISEHRDREARDLLIRMTRERSDDARLFKLLALTEGRVGSPTTAHEYLATHYDLAGDTAAAIQQLKIALRDDGLDFYDRNRIESKLNALRDEQRTEAAWH